MLFWTELKPMHLQERTTTGFRVVLFWTELKLKNGITQELTRFRVVLFWTELKPVSSGS